VLRVVCCVLCVVCCVLCVVCCVLCVVCCLFKKSLEKSLNPYANFGLFSTI
jgi:hypothetical protein